MGGWMTYMRMKNRNGIYRHELLERGSFQNRILMDVERMERDYLEPVYPEAPFALRPAGSDPVSEVVAATGIDEEDVRTVLRYVFREQQ